MTRLKEEDMELKFRHDANKLIRFMERVCVPQVKEIKHVILEQAHKSRLSFHLGSTKMYQDLKRNF